jgi:hypothetical protein
MKAIMPCSTCGMYVGAPVLPLRSPGRWQPQASWGWIDAEPVMQLYVVLL